VEFIGDKEVLSCFAVRVAAAEDGVLLVSGEGQRAAVGEAPGWGGGGGVVFKVFDRPAAFEHKGTEALFAKFFCGPSAADAGADDDGVVIIHKKY